MKTVVVTGASSGIGFAVSNALLSAGYSVIGIGKSTQNCAAAQERLKTRNKGAKVHFICRDLMQQREVLSAAREIEDLIERDFGGELFALINNAGCVRSSFTTTEEGYEQQFALNYLAGFLLTHELMPQIKRCGSAVLFTSSESHKMMKVNWDDLMFQKRYRPLHAYKQSKLCNMLLAHKLREMGVRACGVNPGLVNTDIGSKDTGGIVNLVWKYRKRHGVRPEEAAEIYLNLCENGFDGLYYGSKGIQKPSAEVNAANSELLYETSLNLCGIYDDSIRGLLIS